MSSGQELGTKRGYDGTGCLAIKDINEQDVVSITNYYHVLEDDQNGSGLCNFDTLDWKVTIDEAIKLIAYGGNSKLAIITLQNGDGQTQDMHGVNRKNIVSVALGPNGDLLAAAYEDNTIHIWDLRTRDELTNSYGLYGHDNSITGLQFTPDGKMLISTSLDGTIRFWGVPY